MRFKPNRRRDVKVFRRTYSKTKGINVMPLVSRGGVRQ